MCGVKSWTELSLLALVAVFESTRRNGRRTIWVVGFWDHLVECAGSDAELDRARPPADVAGRAAAEGLGVVPQPHPFRELRYRILRHMTLSAASFERHKKIQTETASS